MGILRKLRGEGDMVALGDKLAGSPIAADNQLAVLDTNVALSGVEGKG